MEMNLRGAIINRDRAKQLHDFSGLKRRRNITPTDIDGFIDLGGRAMIFFEGKVAGTDLPWGQKAALENLCKALHPKIYYLALVFEHNTLPEQDVNVASCVVTNVYNNRAWSPQMAQGRTMLEMINAWEDKYCRGF